MVAFKHKVNLNFGWLAKPILIYLFLGKKSQEFPKHLGRLLNKYFLPKLLVTYGTTVVCNKLEVYLEWINLHPIGGFVYNEAPPW